jgi:hypothetical protein
MPRNGPSIYGHMENVWLINRHVDMAGWSAGKKEKNNMDKMIIPITKVETIRKLLETELKIFRELTKGKSLLPKNTTISKTWKLKEISGRILRLWYEFLMADRPGATKWYKGPVKKGRYRYNEYVDEIMSAIRVYMWNGGSICNGEIKKQTEGLI